MAGVISIVSAHIAPDRAPEVMDGFSTAVRAGMPERRHTSLLRGDNNLWSIITFWHNRSDLDDYLANTPNPFARTLLDSAGGEPTAEIFDVVLNNNSTWWT